MYNVMNGDWMATVLDGTGKGYVMCSEKGEVLSWKTEQSAKKYLISLDESMVRVKINEFPWLILVKVRLVWTNRTEIDTLLEKPHLLRKIQTPNGSSYGLALVDVGTKVLRSDYRGKKI